MAQAKKTEKKTEEELHDIPVISSYPLEVLQAVVVEGNRSPELLEVLADCLCNRTMTQALMAVRGTGSSLGPDGELVWNKSESGTQFCIARLERSMKVLARDEDGNLIKEQVTLRSGEKIQVNVAKDPVHLVDPSLIGQTGKRAEIVGDAYDAIMRQRKQGQTPPDLVFGFPLTTNPAEGQRGLGILDNGIVQDEKSTQPRYKGVVNSIWLRGDCRVLPSERRGNGNGGFGKVTTSGKPIEPSASSDESVTV